MQEKINVDTVGMLLTLQAMMFFALWGTYKVEGILVLIGYGLAAVCFLLFVTLLAFSLKGEQSVAIDRNAIKTIVHCVPSARRKDEE